MAASVFTGEIARLAIDLAAVGPRVRAGADRMVVKACADIQAGARSRCPVDTGFLRSSITTDIVRGSGVTTGEVGPTAHYGAYVEYGTWRMAAQPYLGPATATVEASLAGVVTRVADPGL